MIHTFDAQIAVEYGVNAAILLQNLHYWIEKNRANEVNFFDGKYWTYNSVKAFRELFPYMSTKAINTALAKLLEAGILVTGNYNQSAYDRTLWYAITERGYSILPKSEIHLLNDKYKYAESVNVFEEVARPIVDTLNELRDSYFVCENEASKKEIWYSILQLLPESYNQRRTVQLNYAVLRNMYHARKGHKLDEWRNFCEWMETLPYSRLITWDLT